MNLNDIPLLAMLKGKMGYISQRQGLLAQNVSNADTPGYVPKDLTPFTFEQSLQTAQTAMTEISTVRTNAMHLQTDAPPATPFGNQTKGDSEIRLDGNNVVLEDQMVKLGAARMDYDAAVGFYQQSLALLKTAMKKPGS